MTRPPGPRGLEALGFLGRGDPGGTLSFLEQTARRYGPISYFRLLNQQFYLIDDPELIHEILVTRQHCFIRDTGAALIRELVGDGLLTREEPRHAERRRLLQPLFHRAHISSYAQIMIDEARRISLEWRDGQEIDVSRVMKRLTLTVVGRALFGTDFRESADEIASVLRRVIRRSTRIAPLFALIEPVASLYRRYRPNGRSLFFERERAELERTIEPVLRARKQQQRTDIVSLLLDPEEEGGAGLSDGDVRNEIITLVLAGHETTATALTWGWHLLSKHPDIQTRLQAEVDAVALDRELTAADFEKLTYTAMVFKETLRLHPPVLAFGRRPTQTLALGGYQTPKGASLLLSPYITQRNSRYFPEGQTFQPQRWLNFTPPKTAYFPFGAGAKMCIGDAFARMEGVFILAEISRHWNLERLQEGLPEMSPAPVLNPDRPMRMKTVARTTNRSPFVERKDFAGSL